MTLDKFIEWWLSPLSGATIHVAEGWMVWHARVMVLAWSVLLPLGVLAARYFKVTPKQNWPRQVDNPAWWHAHRALQYSGVVLMLLGVALAWDKGAQSTNIAAWHAYLGWVVVALGAIQVAGAWMRGSKGGPTDVVMRGDHYDMTPHRLWFEGIHKALGWFAVVAAIATVCLGLLTADAPRWMAMVLLLWWLALLAFGTYLERSSRCIDTYQAIWGPDNIHPGNSRQHIGWGMQRPRTHREKK